MEDVDDGEEDSEEVCEGLVVGVVVGLVVMDGDGLQDPVRVAVRDVEGVGVVVRDGLTEDVVDTEELAETEAEAEELVEGLPVAEGERLGVVDRVGVGLVEGHTAHSAADNVKSSHKLNWSRPACSVQVARRAVVVELHGPPTHVAFQYVFSAPAS